MSETDTELLNSARAAVAACTAANKTSAAASHTSQSGSSKSNGECFLSYGNDNEKPPPIVVVVGDGRSRVRRVVRTATRHVTVVSYSTRFKETHTNTSHHVTTVSFPQKTIDARSDTSSQYVLDASQMAPTGSVSSVSNGSPGCIYLQDHCAAPSVISSCSTGSSGSGLQPLYQHHHHHQQQQYPTCHQQQQMLHAGTGAGHYLIDAPTGHYQQQHYQLQPQHHHRYAQQQHHHVHPHYRHHGGAIVIAGSGVGTGMGGLGMSGMGVVGANSAAGMQSSKKIAIRNGNEVHKRSRAQAAYELSQDLLEKKIELLERKYGGVRARNAAITIQRAFRHYMMVKKFASITAMAKAEKRLSRRLVIGSSSTEQNNYGNDVDTPQTHGQHAAHHAAHNMHIYQQQHIHHDQHQPRVTIMAGPPSVSGTGLMIGGGVATASVASGSPGSNNTSLSRTPPTRSMSMRERRQLDGSPIPRSQSGSSTSLSIMAANSNVTHPHVNLLHATEPTHYYTSASAMGGGGGSLQYYVTPSLQHDMSFNSSASSANSSHIDSSFNSSWISGGTGVSPSPHTPYYSAAQIYMRPKVTSQCSASAAAAAAASAAKRIPPEVPKRTSSITQQQQQLLMRQTPLRANGGLCKTAENGSLSSVQSSGSDSSVTSVERIMNCDLVSDRSNSPQTWKRSHHQQCSPLVLPLSAASSHASSASSSSSVTVLANGSNTSADDHQICSHTSAAQYEAQQNTDGGELALAGANANATPNYKVSETIRKRQYRVGLNLFNKKPEKGITYLIRRGFLENTPQGVARFLISRKGLSRQMIGEYLGNLQNQFNMAVLSCFAVELDLSGMQVDVALRKFQTYFRMPGEAQKIERLMEVFSQRYSQCNQDIVGRLRSSDTIFVLAFAIIMLNTDLHTPNLKPERRMRLDDFIKNLRGIDDCHDIDREMLVGIYERVKATEFKPGSDHVTQVMKVQGTIVGKKPNLALPHRRLVCYCRLYEIPDINKRERPGVHQREVFLFNDLLVITKIFSKKKNSVTYTFRNSYPLCGIVVSLLDVPQYPFCIQLSQKVDGKILITFNARNEHDRCKFADDLKESISEMDEMEALRIEAELERQKSARNRAAGPAGDNRDSGVADVELCSSPFPGATKHNSDDNALTVAAGLANTVSGIHGVSQSMVGAGVNANDANSNAVAQQLKRSALSNSLLDMHEQFNNDKPQRRGSVGSLDSGMSISFQSTTTSNASRENAAAVIAAAASAAAAKMRFPLPTVGAALNHQHQHQIHHQQQQQQQQLYNNNHHYGDPAGNPASIYMPQVMLLQQQQQQQQQQQGQQSSSSSARLDENGHSTDV